MQSPLSPLSPFNIADYQQSVLADLDSPTDQRPLLRTRSAPSWPKHPDAVRSDRTLSDEVHSVASPKTRREKRPKTKGIHKGSAPKAGAKSPKAEAVSLKAEAVSPKAEAVSPKAEEDSQKSEGAALVRTFSAPNRVNRRWEETHSRNAAILRKEQRALKNAEMEM
jgi:hypothetical protein